MAQHLHAKKRLLEMLTSWCTPMRKKNSWASQQECYVAVNRQT